MEHGLFKDVEPVGVDREVEEVAFSRCSCGVHFKDYEEGGAIHEVVELVGFELRFIWIQS